MILLKNVSQNDNFWVVTRSGFETIQSEPPSMANIEDFFSSYRFHFKAPIGFKIVFSLESRILISFRWQILNETLIWSIFHMVGLSKAKMMSNIDCKLQSVTYQICNNLKFRHLINSSRRRKVTRTKNLAKTYFHYGVNAPLVWI